MPDFPPFETCSPVFEIEEDHGEDWSEAVVMECPCCGVREFTQRGALLASDGAMVTRLRCVGKHDFDLVLRLEDGQLIARCQVYSTPQEPLV
jgi:hypothetical protein